MQIVMFKRFEADFIERTNRKSAYSMDLLKFLWVLIFLRIIWNEYKLKTLAAILLNRRLQVRILWSAPYIFKKINIKNNDKTVLFVDYTHRGDTLECFESFIKNRAKIDDEKVEYISLNTLMTEALPVIDFNEDYFRLCDYMTTYLACGEISKYAGIPHLKVEDFKDIDEIFNKKNDLTTNLFNLLVIDKLKKQGKLKENPLNKNSL